MTVLEYMKDHILLLDGGMGSMLVARGLQAGECPERWNMSHPEVIVAVQKAYFDAGSNVVNTNTFGANGLKFQPKELEEIVASAIANARAAAEQSEGTQTKFVALDIGPTGRLLKPYGDLDFEDAVEAFAQVVRLGVKYGADLIFIETMSDSYETKAALLAAKENAALPVFVSNAYGAGGKLMTGASPAAMVAMLEGMGADVIGANCSLGPKQLRSVMEELLACASVPVLLKPNAGLPHVVDGKSVYDVLPAEFAAEVADLVDQGVAACGGCCGTTPEYIAALCAAVDGKKPLCPTDKGLTVISSYTQAVNFGAEPVLIGDRICPGDDMEDLVDEAMDQQDDEVQVLRIGLSEGDDPTQLTCAVGELQTVINLPLQLDTEDPVAMEAALRRYNGKAMVSVSDKAENMAAIFPLVKKYGGVVAVQTADEAGSKVIRETAEKYGISGKDMIFSAQE